MPRPQAPAQAISAVRQETIGVGTSIGGGDANLEGPPPDWHAPKVSLFVSGLPRSGSSLLCHSIRELDLIGKPHEFFNVGFVRGQTGEPVSNLIRCFFHARDSGFSQNMIFASKLLWAQFEPVLNRFDFNAWFPNQRWVFLQRRDLLVRQYPWLSRRRRGNGTQALNQRQHRSIARICHRKSGTTKLLHAFMAALFRPAQNRSSPNLYEDLEKDLHTPIAAIAQLVGGADLEAEVRRTEPFQHERFPMLLEKQRTQLNQDWRLRFLGGS